ncbi:MAG: glycosyltransferase [Bacteroidota bacterium]
MKLFYISNNWIDKGACTVYSTYNVWGIAQNKVDTHLFVRNVSEGDTADLLRQYFNLDYPEHLTIHRIEKRFKKANMEFYWIVTRMIKELADEHTVVITRTPKILPYLLMIPRRKFRIYYETHNFFHDLKLRDDLQKLKFAHYKNAIQGRMTVKRIDGLICLTETQKKLWTQYVNLPIYVVYPGLISAHHNYRTFEAINLAYTGSLDKGRGIDYIIDMAGYLPAYYHIYVFGGIKANEMERLHKELKWKNVAHKITITGWLNQTELQKRLGKMHLGLLPLKDNFFNRYLTAPSKLFDYLSHSLPAVASPLPSLEELVKDLSLGIIADWNKPDEVASQIVQLMSDIDRYNAISNKAYSFALQHTWEKRGEKLVEALFE